MASIYRRPRPNLGVLIAMLVVLLGSLAAPASPAAAGPDSCVATAQRPPVVVLHDLAGTPESVASLSERIAATGRCVVPISWGPMPLLVALGIASPGLPGGLASMAASAPVVGGELVDLAGATPKHKVDVVAVGAGSLVALRTVQLEHRLPVRRLVSLGPLWRGTNLLGLGDLEQLSRDAGTYDVVLGLEKLLMDGACASCREFIKGSDFLRELRAGGLRPPGLRQVDVLSRTDGLVVPWTSGRRARVTTLVVQDQAVDSAVSHFALPGDSAAQRLVLQGLRMRVGR